ncbi:unnamed protein product [Nippostrongylus brasiliensis]|uniref:Trimethyllysine dioxygenase, mitochondrial n=1 Tax=Nippostrongylus brasiliensis TaxID=27835 RepID=A0A0N4XEU8_NIPBR|nr:unnamed protein product [Nippostrongylus brasiliensis]
MGYSRLGYKVSNIEKRKQHHRLVVPLVWLRDHCRHPNRYNQKTNQRVSNATDLLEKAEVDGEERIIITEGSKISIHWADGQESVFNIDKLVQDSVVDEKPVLLDETVQPWNFFVDIFRSKFDMKTIAEHFVKYGVVMIDGVEESADATEELCRRVTPIHDTFYGPFWVFSNQTKEKGEYHEDTAYGNDTIGPHTDGTYFNQTPGIQVFHCLHPAEEGGDTILVDGFSCALQLKSENPAAFKLLSEKKIEHHYVEIGDGSNQLYSTAVNKPVIELDPHGNVVQIRFNPYDRAPFRVLLQDDRAETSAREVLAFYRAYEAFSKICHSEQNATSIGLRPGTVIFIDNFRVFHSRTSFKGWRQMCGCYLSRDNFMAKARPLLPEHIRRYV